MRERVLEERRREREAGIERPRRDREQMHQELEAKRRLYEQRKLEEQRALEEERRLQEQAKAQAKAQARENQRRGGWKRNPREPQALPTEKLDPVEQARLLEEAGYEHSWDLTHFEGGAETQPATSAETEGATETGGRARASEPEAEPEDHPRAGTDSTVTRVPIERKVIVVRAPRGWPRIVLAAVEVAVISWAVLVAVALVAFLATAQNPWLLEADWNTAIGVGADIWAMSYGAPVVAGGVFVRMIPLGLTALHVLLARAGLRRARAASWQGSILFIPAYVLTVILLMLVTSLHAHKGWLILGALLVASLAWVWSLRSREWDPQWLAKSGPYLRGVRDGLIATSSLAILGLVVAVVGTIAGWSRVLGIQELLNASIFDRVVLWIAQLLYLPNIAAWGASWLTGPGFYTASDAIITPSRADITAIPAIPLMGALPQTEIGIWVVLIPIAVGIALGAFMVWKRRETAMVDHLLHAGFAFTTMLILVTAWMWLSTGSIGVARMSLLGPRWIYATLFGTLEIGLTATLIYALAHPLLLAKYVAGGRFAKASTLNAVESASQKIQTRRGKLSTDVIDEDEAEISPESDSATDNVVKLEVVSEGGATNSSEIEGETDNSETGEEPADETIPEATPESTPNDEGAVPADSPRETKFDAAGVESETGTGKAPSSKESQDDEPRR